MIENVSFDNVTLHLVDSPLNPGAGGNVDLRPVLNPALELFRREVSALLAKWVKNLRIRGFDLAWGDVRQDFFTNALEVEHFDGLTIDGLHGTAAPSQRGTAAIALRNGRGADLGVGSASISRTNVVER